MSHAMGNEDAPTTAGRSATPAETTESAETTDSAEQNLGSLGDAGHTFDQTNGLVDGLQGDSDGFAEDGDDGTDGGEPAVPLIAPEGQ